MGLHPYIIRPRGDPLDVDFVWATRVLNSTSTLLGLTARRLEAIRILAERIRHCTHQRSVPSIRVSDPAQAHAVYKRMEQRCAHLEHVCLNLLLEADCELKRTQAQLSAVSGRTCCGYLMVLMLTN